MLPRLDDAQANAALDRTRERGAREGRRFVRDITGWGGPEEWEALLNERLVAFRLALGAALPDVLDPLAPHAVSLLADYFEEGFRETLREFFEPVPDAETLASSYDEDPFEG